MVGRRARSSIGLAVVLVVSLGSATRSLAVEPGEVLSDPALESRARHLSGELRCLVCQNQSIDDSNAPLAKDLRVIVRERLAVGDSDRQVLDFVVARYGEFVLLRPPFAVHTLLLWLTPLAVLLSAGWWIAGRTRTTSAAAPATLSDSERRRLAELLADSERDDGDARINKA